MLSNILQNRIHIENTNHITKVIASQLYAWHVFRINGASMDLLFEYVMSIKNNNDRIHCTFLSQLIEMPF